MFKTEGKLRKVNIKFVRAIIWSIALIALFFQCYYPKLSSLIVPAVLGYVLMNAYTIKREPCHRWLKLFWIYVIYITVSVLVSLFLGRDFGNVVRFTTILLMIPLVLLEDISQYDIEWKLFKLIIGAKAISIIVIWFIVFIQQDYIAWRQWAMSIGAGDIYILYGIPRVQLQGNSLLLFAAVSDIEKNDRYNWFNLLLIFSVLCAGNSAFYLGLFIYISIRLLRRLIKSAKEFNRNGVFIIAIISVFAIVFLVYGVRQLEIKSSGVEDTNRVRIEQAELLLDTNPLFGSGIGSYANGKISTRVYKDQIYFELQSLYIFHQVGFVGMTLVLLLTFLPMFYNKRALVVYSIYLIYTFWNPYCFDTTHILVLLIISNNFIKVEEFESSSRINHCVLSQ
ncbi:hypothetical protein [Pseudobutyrivibrio ruminis]|uniref:O-antigen ligase like membrane protein n=1 Tax=Pseudobutyrivibrio ruminis TaxID=46206 RepID=A0A2G3DTV3_9FIRM|nr:hypothetical protein [Pseudobutyrivibrio ruminis]PHU34371.1 hypothetical protein CSX01_10270 [Pseudobutyrivibrio ruminis]